MPPRSANVQVPGEVLETPAESIEPAADEQVSVSKSVLETLLAEVASLKAKVGAAPAKRAAPVVDLPDQSEVDPDKIKTAVLTKQGYVVPTGYGSFPGEKKV